MMSTAEHPYTLNEKQRESKQHLTFLVDFNFTHDISRVMVVMCDEGWVAAQVVSKRSGLSVTLGLRRNWAEQWVMLDFIQFGETKSL